MLHRAYALSSATEAFNGECAKVRSIFSQLERTLKKPVQPPTEIWKFEHISLIFWHFSCSFSYFQILE